ncbi:MAG: hypothetical protein LBV29_06570 [Azoarcus sp.]|jgi:hypothetical protein|nr:hypothetical protein [Azoarcus sp.]
MKTTPFILRWLNSCLLLGLLLSVPVSAQTPDAPHAPNRPVLAPNHARPAYVTQARETIDAVLAEPEFDRTRITKVPKPRKPSSARKDAKLFDIDLTRLHGIGRLISQAGEIILWLLAFGLIVLLVIRAKHWLPFLDWRRSSANPLPPAQSSVLEIVAALPEDIATAAERCWKEGRKEEALSLLYRGAIKLLTAHHRVDLPQGATEEEVRLLVGNAMPSFKDDFGNIARAWLRLAYAHRPPADIAGLLAGFGRLQQAGGVTS